MAITFDAAAATTAAGVTTLDWSHTCSGTERFLIVGLRSNASVTSVVVQYNGVAMTLITSITTSGAQLRTYYMINPPAGTYTVHCTWTTARDTWGASHSYNGVHQTTAFTTPGTNEGTSTTPSSSVTSANGDLVVDFVESASAVTMTEGAGQTYRTKTDRLSSSEKAATSTPTTTGWTLSGSVLWKIISVPISPASPPAASSSNFFPFF